MSGKDAFCSSTILEMSFSVIFLIMMFAIVVSGEVITCYKPILIIRKECLNLDLNPKAIIAILGGSNSTATTVTNRLYN